MKNILDKKLNLEHPFVILNYIYKSFKVSKILFEKKLQIFFIVQELYQVIFNIDVIKN